MIHRKSSRYLACVASGLFHEGGEKLQKPVNLLLLSSFSQLHPSSAYLTIKTASSAGYPLTDSLLIVAFVRMHPNLGVPIVQSHTFSRYSGRLPHWFFQGYLGWEPGLLLTQLNFRKWYLQIRNQWSPLVLSLLYFYHLPAEPTNSWHDPRIIFLSRSVQRNEPINVLPSEIFILIILFSHDSKSCLFSLFSEMSLLQSIWIREKYKKYIYLYQLAYCDQYKMDSHFVFTKSVP